MITKYQQENYVTNKAMLALLMRVNQKLIFTYIYDDYEGKNTFKKLIQLGNNFSDKILTIN